jgi:hypothetical protein
MQTKYKIKGSLSRESEKKEKETENWSYQHKKANERASERANGWMNE